jgi:hypothetical protein
MDGKGIVMHSADLREQTGKAAQKAGRQIKMRLAPGEKKHRQRMATVGSVKKESQEVIEDVFCAATSTEKENKRDWVILVD